MRFHWGGTAFTGAGYRLEPPLDVGADARQVDVGEADADGDGVSHDAVDGQPHESPLSLDTAASIGGYITFL